MDIIVCIPAAVLGYFLTYAAYVIVLAVSLKGLGSLPDRC